MSLRKVMTWGMNRLGYVVVDDEATKGAVVGTNLEWADGEEVVEAEIRNVPVEDEAVSDSTAVRYDLNTHIKRLAATVPPAGATLVGMPSVAGSTYGTLQDTQDTFHSSGWISGGAITDAGSGNIDVAAGVGYLRSTNSATGNIFNIDWAAISGEGTTADSLNYVIVEWNAGAPQIITPLPVTDTSDSHTSWVLGVVVNEGGVLYVIPHTAAVGDHALKMINRIHATNHIQRDEEIGGLILSSTGTNDIEVSAGALWLGLSESAISAIDTAAASVFDSYYNNGSGFTKEGTGIGLWDNLNYESAGTLTALGNNKYVVLWWYMALDGSLVMLYGNAQYNSAAVAENEAAPSSVPLRIQAHGILIGRFIIKKSAVTAETVQTVFDSMFNSIGVTSHLDLTDIGSNTHAQIDAHIALIMSGSGSPEGVVTAPVGNLFTRTDGGAGTSLYVKESGTGDTGWIGK